MKAPTEAEMLMGYHLRELLRLPNVPFHTEFVFHEDRKWRFDFAAPALRMAVEIEGGLNVWGRRDKNGDRLAGRHTRGRGYQQDLDKYNAATALGWTVFRFSTQDVLNGRDLEVLKKWLERRSA